ncbi:coiled-coil domain-containing protein 137 isoform X4 [Phyllostomus discolor]|uniref:Coiled-coil domain-containing protein 137 isoform X4 n=1 Tax=Phyllostomus discolor TaxID=89673 RepID=A0A6J2MB42_9CHIR|nr:coiled-coil domain-containing protein 137 isoform X4 [Phyllostomus discolor]
MARAGRRAAVPAGTAGPGGPGRPQGRRQQQPPQGKQRSAPWPRPRSQEKKKVNCKPKNQDEQEIPFRLREIMKSRQEMKNPVSNKKRKKEARAAFRRTLEKEAQGVDPEIAVPKFQQRKGESDGAYVQRMEQEAQHVLFLSRNRAAPRPEAQAAPKEKSERKKAFRRRRLDKVRQRREEKAVEKLEQELLQDTVKFGEVALQPPELTAKPRTRVSMGQPGRKSLILGALLSPGGAPQPPASSMARQRIVAEERARAVQAYRAMKTLRREWREARSARCPPEKQPGTSL